MRTIELLIGSIVVVSTFVDVFQYADALHSLMKYRVVSQRKF